MMSSSPGRLPCICLVLGLLAAPVARAGLEEGGFEDPASATPYSFALPSEVPEWMARGVAIDTWRDGQSAGKFDLRFLQDYNTGPDDDADAVRVHLIDSIDFCTNEKSACFLPASCALFFSNASRQERAIMKSCQRGRFAMRMSAASLSRGYASLGKKLSEAQDTLFSARTPLGRSTKIALFGLGAVLPLGSVIWVLLLSRGMRARRGSAAKPDC